MKRKKKQRKWQALFAVSVSLLILWSCSGGGDGDTDETMTATYRISIANLTQNQPLSPPAAVLHAPGYSPWMAGDAASDGIEQLAEGGNAAQFIDDATADDAVKAASAGAGAIGPGMEQVSEMTVNRDSDLHISFAAMLVNTNDAFTGIKSLHIGNLEVDESTKATGIAYDAGTEGNSEAASDIPGPAGGGEGANSARDDRDFISVHQGVVTADDGLSTSALDQSHRWLNPVVQVTVTRIE